MQRLLWSMALIAASGLAAAGQYGVRNIFPSGNQLPANALRLSVEFTEPQSRAILPHLGIRDQYGTQHPNIFLQQELWSPDRQMLTVLFDPGRLKTGTMRHASIGAPLAGYTEVELTFDGVGVKRWRVDATGCGPLNPKLWKIEWPHQSDRSTLCIRFPKAIDRQAEHLLAVVNASGQRITGSEQLTSFETQWIFTPDAVWAPGLYRVVVHPDLEDPCGDRVGEAFEHPGDSHVEALDELRFVIR